MAVVILGGLVTSTLLNLLVLPALYLRFGADSIHPNEVGFIVRPARSTM
jgi:Cu/Ag efflux pump CusA